MAYYIQRPSLVDSNITVFYVDGATWSNNESQKKLFETEELARSVIDTEENIGWNNTVILSE